MTKLLDPSNNKRVASYLARAVTRGDKGATAALEYEFPGEAQRIAEYSRVYHDPQAVGHDQLVKDVALWYEAAGDWLALEK
jgi:hypothetical protein